MAHRDFEEFLGALNARGVRFLVVGAHAVAFHARPRATKDLDLYIEPTRKNALLLLHALQDFFGTALSHTVEDLLNPETVIQLGVAPVRIDLLNDLPGVKAFAAAWKRRATGKFGSVDASYLSLQDLVAAKIAAGRPQDLADLAVLKRATKRKRK